MVYSAPVSASATSVVLVLSSVLGVVLLGYQEGQWGAVGEVVMLEDRTGAFHINSSDPNQYPVFINGVDVGAVFSTVTASNAERCLKSCPAGQYVSQWCTEAEQNKCSSCPAFTSKLGTGLDTSCQPCVPTHCGQDTYMVPCTSDQTTENQCMPCPPGTYQDNAQHRETSCKSCTDCGEGEFLLSTNCTASNGPLCLPGGIRVLGADGCAEGQWRFSGSLLACETSTSHQNTYLEGGSFGSNTAFTAISRVQIAQGTYNFTCRVDDCCKISLAGPVSVSPISFGTSCTACASCATTTVQQELPSGEYLVQYYGQDVGSSSHYKFFFDRA
ncbi:hypothetical protein PTSG_10030 [Salpingoeca rosetta]|uniref:TNFR-Cys domain-containing protein n=1 Tax=Salpingoeca rosetta (strain ATCC 50818 / BSB-021) TaxID=946362 RepID=F2UPA9_SALR5|nr:uncharacterized protein PTSG_10030 [Salpingoeca rosetta]EGD79464.1 hypothetical protein PTSG_10030 [Salpingoeca rosetta]|eukprot:XP_004988945.1 hypothetical protein PTSG_10030 [Salpingoeca rosetta]